MHWTRVFAGNDSTQLDGLADARKGVEKGQVDKAPANPGLSGTATSSPVLTQEGMTASSGAGMVVSVSKLASQIGRDVLKSGGNAVDAAVAVGFALAVTWPEAGNIGGGGFMLVHPGDDKGVICVDYREKAPAAATVDMFAKSFEPPCRQVGVPGTVRGFKLAHERFGRLPWKSLVNPAVALARDGFVVDGELAGSLNAVINRSRDRQELLRVYGRDQGKTPWKAGDRLIQNDLAATLQTIADEGADAFYTGKIADAIEQEMQRGGGIFTKADLAAYEAIIRSPIHGSFRGFDIFVPPPPSSGGIALVQMLNIMEQFDSRREGRWSAVTMHRMIECMRRAFCDRARFLGDADFNEIPQKLTSKEYAVELAKTIHPDAATLSSTIGADILTSAEGPHTTHFSVIDRDGMAVSNTYTLEDNFGSRVVVRSAGFLLNNEMGDFNRKPGVTDSTGQIGTKPNQVAPGKRMLSSMTPTIVSKKGRVVFVTGSPGGRTIINTLLCTVLNLLEFEMPPREAVDSPRFHHAWMPDNVWIEADLLNRYGSEIEKLKSMGHKVGTGPSRQGDAHSISVDADTGQRLGVADRRRNGWAAGE